MATATVAADSNAADYTPVHLPLTTLALGLATFMRVLDTTVANVSLPTIAGNLGVSYNDSTWVVTSFTVCMAITLPLTGFLSRRFGEVRLFIWCTILFSLASMMCGLSDSFGMLLVFRAIQGAVSGPVYPIAQSLMIATYPKNKRGMALAIIAMIAIVAPVVGPVLGGWLTDRYSWHWIFFINVPIGIFAGIVALAQLSGMRQKIERPRMDYVGLIALIAGVGSLQVVLDRGQDLDWFHSNEIVILALIAAFALLVFVVWELTDDKPIVDLKLFRHHNFAVGTVVLILSYAVFFGISLLLPLWTQKVLGYTALWAGLAMAPVGLFPVFATYFIGKYGPRFDLRLLASASFVVVSVTCLLNAGFNTQVDFTAVALNRLFQGVGVALFFMPILTILLSDLKGDEIASGSGLSTFLYQMGASFSASIVTFVWDRGAATDHSVLAQFVTPVNPPALHAEHLLGGGLRALDALNKTITQQAFQLSFDHLMVVLAALMFALIPLLWLTRPPFIRGAAAGRH
ncbi:MAG TPA: DHA2 family efflux MFS transporter permease subunit [Nevskiaceae bacterium]|nr:DHA2 family efflux MFS transporter permease subunit [Nevskiaceae bacterium]